MESKVLETQKTKKKFKLTWRDVKDYILVLAGALLQAVGTWLFTLPGSLVSGGVFGLAQIIYYKFNIPVGLIALVFNIPLFVLGWKHLGGFRFAIRTVIAIVVSSVLIDLLTTLPATKGMQLTESALLNTLFGGVLVGVGLGLVYL